MPRAHASQCTHHGPSLSRTSHLAESVEQELDPRIRILLFHETAREGHPAIAVAEEFEKLPSSHLGMFGQFGGVTCWGRVLLHTSRVSTAGRPPDLQSFSSRVTYPAALRANPCFYEVIPLAFYEDGGIQ